MTLDDAYSFLTPAKVKILLVPINNCTVPDFNRYVYTIRHETNKHRFGAISDDDGSSNTDSADSPLIIPDFQTTPIDENQVYLHEFEPFRKVFIVIGIGPELSSDTAKTGFDHRTELRRIYSSAIVHEVIEFNENTNIKSCLYKLSFLFTDALNDFAAGYSAITLRSPVSITDSHVVTKTISKAEKRLSSGSTSFRASFNGGSIDEHILGDASTATSASGTATATPTRNTNTNSTATSTTTSTSTSTSTLAASKSSGKLKTQSKYAGRHFKLMGNLHLLAGRYSDALTSFTEGLTILKRHNDFLWLGSCIEGLSVAIFLIEYTGQTYQLSPSISSTLQITKSSLVDYNESRRRSSLESNGSKISINASATTITTTSAATATATAATASPRNSITSNGFSLPLTTSVDLNTIPFYDTLKLSLTKAIYFYGQSTSDTENMVPDVVYIECILRKLNLMVASRIGTSYDYIMETVINRTGTEIATAFPSKDILCDVDKIFLLQLVELPIDEQCRIFSYIAKVYRSLGLFRKEAFVTRFQILTLMPHLNVHNLPEAKKLIESLFKIYKINLACEGTAHDAQLHSQGSWTSLQIQVLRLALNLAEQSEDDAFLQGLCILLLTRFSHCLPFDDQLKLRDKMIGKKVTTKLPYWDPFLVRKVKYVSTRASQDVHTSTPILTRNKEIISEPFYDPYTTNKSGSHNKPDLPKIDHTVIEGELHQLKISMQNPFAFDLDINDIEVVSEGVRVVTFHELTQVVNSYSAGNSIDTSIANFNKLRVKEKRTTVTNTASSLYGGASTPFVLRAMSTEQFLVTFKATDVGKLVIKGFNIQVWRCEKQFFPIIDKEKRNEHGIKLKSVVSELGENSQQLALDKRTFASKETTHSSDLKTIDSLLATLRASATTERVSHRHLVLNVIPPQPVLRLKDLSIRNGCVMVLEGESIDFTVTLVNESMETINYLSFSFWDTAIEFFNNKLYQSPYLKADEVYELEWQLLNFKSFRVKNKDVLGEVIKPKEELVIEFELVGRKLMSQSLISLDYAHKTGSDCFTKHLDVPITVSVMPSVEIVGCDIIHVFPDSILNKSVDFINTKFEAVQRFIKEAGEIDTSEYCILVLDLKNLWNNKMQCTLSYDNFEFVSDIEISKTERFFLPIRKIKSLDYKQIPSLRNKQFIKDYNLGEQEEELMKRLFWIRQHVLDKLKISWETYKRRGSVNLRKLMITPRMASVIVLENLVVENRIVTAEGEEVASEALKTDEFYILETKITNRLSNQSLSGFINHYPAVDLGGTNGSSRQISTDRKILIEGVLQKLCPVVKPNSSIISKLSFIIVERGEYVWDTVFESKDSRFISKKPLRITAS
ncbi:hypothetical protein PVL30_002369 [Lodderomyces elongisporus]|uniref:uncharacterized protein n=1 Tax=Lodderomyces elongisporus TaxID=36914 RepID=UPI0029268782|nr:uncharacterized protein PVL30_002369 [Lodderomyces elongisporus]WLF78629.1 hypothetical protein PVL30_002369 [Lodderomyces elongisporus]